MGAPFLIGNSVVVVFSTLLAHWVSFSRALRCLNDSRFPVLQFLTLRVLANYVAMVQDHDGGNEASSAQNDHIIAEVKGASSQKEAQKLASCENIKNEIKLLTKRHGQKTILLLLGKMTQEEKKILAKKISKLKRSTKHKTRYWKMGGLHSVDEHSLQTEAQCTVNDRSGLEERKNDGESPEKVHATEETCLKEIGMSLHYSPVCCTQNANSSQADGSHDMKNCKKGTKCVFEIQTSPSSHTSSMNEALLQVKSAGSCPKSYEELCYCEGSFCRLERDIKADGISNCIGIHLAKLSGGNKEGAMLLLLRSLIYQGPVDSRINPQWMLMCWWTVAIGHGLQMAPICGSIKNNVKLGSLMQDVLQEAGVAESGQSMDGHGDQTGQTLYSKPIKTVLHGAQTTCGQPMDGNGDQTGQSSGKSLPNSATQSEGNGAVNKNTGTGLPNTCGNSTPGGSGDGEDPRRHIKLTPGHYTEKSGQAGANTKKSISKTENESCSSKQNAPRTNCNPEASGSSASGGAAIDSNLSMEAEQHEIRQTNDATQIGFKHVGGATAAATSNPVQSTTHSCPPGVKAHCGTSAYDRPGEVDVSSMGHGPGNDMDETTPPAQGCLDGLPGPSGDVPAGNKPSEPHGNSEGHGQGNATVGASPPISCSETLPGPSGHVPEGNRAGNHHTENGPNEYLDSDDDSFDNEHLITTALAPHFLQNANAQRQNRSVASGGVNIGDNPNLLSEQPNIHETNNNNQPTGNEHTERAVLAPCFLQNALEEPLIAPLHIPPQEGNLSVPLDITDTNLIDSRVKRNQCRSNGEQQDMVGALIDLVEAERVDLHEFDPLREERLRPDVRAANLGGPGPKAGSDVDSLRDGFFRPYQDVTQCDDERSPVSSTDSENSTYGGDSMYRPGSQGQPRSAHFQYNESILDRNIQWDPGDAVNNIQQPLNLNCCDDIPFEVNEHDNRSYEAPVDRQIQDRAFADAILPQEVDDDNQEAEIVDHLIRPDRAFVDARLPLEDVEVDPRIVDHLIRPDRAFVDARLPLEDVEVDPGIVDHLIRPDRAFVDARLPLEDVEVDPGIVDHLIRPDRAFVDARLPLEDVEVDPGIVDHLIRPDRAFVDDN